MQYIDIERYGCWLLCILAVLLGIGIGMLIIFYEDRIIMANAIHSSNFNNSILAEPVYQLIYNVTNSG